MSNRGVAVVLFALTLGACELIVDFDPEEAENRQAIPKPIPGLDGSRPIVPDAAAISDSTLVRPPNDGGRDAAGDASQDGGNDAALDPVTDAGLDARVEDAGMDASESDAQADGGGMDGAVEPVVDASEVPADAEVPADGSEPGDDGAAPVDLAEAGADAS